MNSERGHTGGGSGWMGAGGAVGLGGAWVGGAEDAQSAGDARDRGERCVLRGGRRPVYRRLLW